MNGFSFAIHGTPGKSECWGMPNDDGYLKSFYDKANSATEQTRLDIDLRIVDNMVCSYYHYLKLNNISNGDARKGGYFGMSIRFEGSYCSDVKSLFTMFELLFEKVVCKSILERDGINTKYRFLSFKDCQAELEDVKSKVIKALDQFNNDIKRFPQNYLPKHSGEITQFNVSDTGSDFFQQVLFQDAEVYISSEYPLLVDKLKILEKERREQSELIKSQQKELSQKEGRITELNDTVANQGRTIKNQETEITNQSSEIRQQESAISNLQNDLNNANQTIKKKDDKISEQIASINQQSVVVSNLQNELNQAKQSISDLNKELQNKTLSEADVKKIDQCISVLNRCFNQETGFVEFLTTASAKQTQLGNSLNSVRQDLDTIQNGIKGYKNWLLENANKDQNGGNGGPRRKERRSGRNNRNGDFQLGNDGENRNRNRKILIPLLAFIVILGGLVFLIFGDFQEEKNNKNFKSGKTESQSPQDPQIKSLQSELSAFKEATNKQFDNVNQKMSELSASIKSVSTNADPIHATSSNYSNEGENALNSDNFRIDRIDIKGGSEPLIVSTTYTLRLVRDGKPVDFGGQFECSENAEITNNSSSECNIKVLDKSQGSITVSYKKDNKVLKTRTIQVK